MKKVVLSIALAVLTFAGAAQQTKKPDTKKPAAKKTTAAAKPTPKPTPKTSNTAKKPTTKPAQNTAINSKKPIQKQTQNSASTNKKPATKLPPKKDEKAELEKALAIENAEQRVTALTKFLVDFPKTESRSSVIESLTSSRIAAAEAKFDAGDREGALKLVRAAIDEAPVPYPEKLFNDFLGRVPSILHSHGENQTASELASAIEKNAATNAAQLVTLATFYLSTENGAEAKRLAEAAIKVDEKSAAAYQVLGMANRVNFDLDSAAAAYEKAVELETDSVPARQSLAELKRAIGKPDEAIALFSSLLEKDPTDLRSVNGRILALFDAGKRADAEAEMSKLIESEPNDFVLFAGVSYWYAANGENSKAIDLAGKAVAIEPRYIWSHIALARALTGDGRPTDAEQVLLKAKKYGNFPTLDYELAATKFASGFYREAADELQKSFAIKDGVLVTKLGRRVERTDKNFIDLLASERRASILAPKAADSLEQAEKLRMLLELRTVLSEKSPDEAKAVDAASAFAAGSDKMRFHRQLFAAGELLERSVALSKVLEFSKAAVSSLDDGLNVNTPAAPLMAAELYSSRTTAIAADKYVLVPDVPKQTLSAIARGRVEEIAGEALLLQKNNAEAVVRLRRAVSILPEKSAWWKSSYWRLGAALEADGKDKEALDAFAKSYTGGDPDASRYAEIETVYKRVNGNTDGIETLIGANPAKSADSSVTASSDTKAETPRETSTEKKVETEAAKIAEPSPSPQAEKPVAVPEASPTPEPETKKQIDEKPIEVKPTPTEEPSPKPTETNKGADEKKPPVTEEPSPKPAEVPATLDEKKPTETKPVISDDSSVNTSDRKKDDPEQKSADTKPTPKPLFEPVVIEIKNSKSPKEKEVAKAESADETKKTETSQEKDASGSARPRVVVGKDIAVDTPPACSISVSQDNISVIGGNGSVGILVGSDGGDVKEIKFSSSSPKDVEVVAEPEIAGVSGRALYVIRSVSTAAGVYQVTFTSPCGKKDVTVRVR